MPIYDRECPACGKQLIDCYERIETPVVACPSCGQPTTRVILGASHVIGDECDITIEHGLCDAQGNPVRYTSKTEIARAAKARGLMQWVEHVPERGSDKSPHTTRWI